jgi:2-keto-4-pentenoate hydratase/2-oxohepta-3-ene-1,7-dioic acid hydratase in catechol pathway
MHRLARVLRNGRREFIEADTLSPEELRTLTFLPPCDPTKILGLAFNYKSLVGSKETYDEPLFFLKSPTSACGHNAKVSCAGYPVGWVEAELAVIIKKECRNVNVDKAGDYILGYTIGSDITAENVHGRDWHLGRSKALDNFAPLGPFLVTDIDTSDLELGTRINGKLYQQGRTSDRIKNDYEAVSMVSRFLTLSAGDVILTGTPAGATSSLVKPGDVVTHWIEKIGELNFTIV